MTKQELLRNLRAERKRWEELLAQLDEAQMSDSGSDGGWSVKDIIAHVTWHEREIIGVMRSRALVGSELWNLPLDERNAAIFEENRDRTLAEVLTEANQIFPELVQHLEMLSEEDLNDPGRFREMPADWLPWQLIADNTYWHYQNHREELEGRLAN